MPDNHSNHTGGVLSAVTTVLIVDDHTQLREEIVRLVDGAAGFDVIGEAESGEEAVEKARSLDPDLVVMDIVLPNMNGVDATRAILQADPDTVVLGLSNYANRGLVQKMLDTGARGYIRKDYAFEELLDALRAVMTTERFVGTGIDVDGHS